MSESIAGHQRDLIGREELTGRWRAPPNIFPRIPGSGVMALCSNQEDGVTGNEDDVILCVAGKKWDQAWFSGASTVKPR